MIIGYGKPDIFETTYEELEFDDYEDQVTSARKGRRRSHKKQALKIQSKTNKPRGGEKTWETLVRETLPSIISITYGENKWIF